MLFYIIIGKHVSDIALFLEDALYNFDFAAILKLVVLISRWYGFLAPKWLLIALIVIFLVCSLVLKSRRKFKWTDVPSSYLSVSLMPEYIQHVINEFELGYCV